MLLATLTKNGSNTQLAHIPSPVYAWHPYHFSMEKSASTKVTHEQTNDEEKSCEEDGSSTSVDKGR
jgi:hypothetical protein